SSDSARSTGLASPLPRHPTTGAWAGDQKGDYQVKAALLVDPAHQAGAFEAAGLLQGGEIRHKSITAWLPANSTSRYRPLLHPARSTGPAQGGPLVLR